MTWPWLWLVCQDISVQRNIVILSALLLPSSFVDKNFTYMYIIDSCYLNYVATCKPWCLLTTPVLDDCIAYHLLFFVGDNRAMWNHCQPCSSWWEEFSRQVSGSNFISSHRYILFIVGDNCAVWNHCQPCSSWGEKSTRQVWGIEGISSHKYILFIVGDEKNLLDKCEELKSKSFHIYTCLL